MRKLLCALLIASSTALYGAAGMLESKLLAAIQYESPRLLQEAVVDYEKSNMAFNTNRLLAQISSKWRCAWLKKESVYALTPVISLTTWIACFLGVCLNSLSESEWHELEQKSLRDIIENRSLNQQKKLLKTGTLLSLGSIALNAPLIWNAQRSYARRKKNLFAMTNILLDSKAAVLDYSTMENSVKQLISCARNQRITQ